MCVARSKKRRLNDFAKLVALSVANFLRRKPTRTRVVAIALYLALFAWSIERFGLPVDRIAVTGWVLVAFIFANVGKKVKDQIAMLRDWSIFAGMLFAYKSGRIRVTPKFTKVLTTALLGYLVLGLVSFVAYMFTGSSVYNVGGLGLIIATGGMVLAAFFLILDFDSIQNGIAAGAPESESWRAAFGLMVTIIWLYMEVLRVLSILRGND